MTNNELLVTQAMVIVGVGLLVVILVEGSNRTLYERLSTKMADQTGELQAALDELKQAITNEKAKVTSGINDLKTKIAELEAAIQQGQDLTPYIAQVKQEVADVQGIVDAPVPDPLAARRRKGA